MTTDVFKQNQKLYVYSNIYIPFILIITLFNATIIVKYKYTNYLLIKH